MTRGRPKKITGWAKKITVTFEEEDLNRLKEKAKKERLSLSSYIRNKLIQGKSFYAAEDEYSDGTD